MKRIFQLSLFSACFVLIAFLNARADSAIVFDSVRVDLKISEISNKTVRIELQPIESHTNSRAFTAPWTLAGVSAKGIFHSQDLGSEPVAPLVACARLDLCRKGRALRLILG